MYRPQWIRFSWDLKKLPAEAPPHEVKSVELRKAEPDDAHAVWTFLERAFATEQAWGMTLKERMKHLKDAVFQGIEEKNVEYWLLEHGKKIVAGTGLLLDAGAPMQLISGICVMEEYRCRGLGTWLLHAGLKRMADAGLASAAVVTRSNTHAARYLYPKFAATSAPVEAFPEIKQFT
jgi:N-acetylglutamate synthase-like GNAT family acetyltransferase